MPTRKTTDYKKNTIIIGERLGTNGKKNSWETEIDGRVSSGVPTQEK